MLNNKKTPIVIASISLILFVIVMVLVLIGKTTVFDDSIYNFLIGLRNNGVDIFFKTITKCGNIIPVIIISIIVLLFTKNNIDKVTLCTTVLTTVASNQVLKHIICRPRPDHLRLIKEGGFSFPSGHAMISMSLYGLLIYLVYKNINNKYLKVLLIIILSMIIILIGSSRIYVGVHYPSDILGGYLLSFGILIINIVLCNKLLGGEK